MEFYSTFMFNSRCDPFDNDGVAFRCGGTRYSISMTQFGSIVGLYIEEDSGNEENTGGVRDLDENERQAAWAQISEGHYNPSSTKNLKIASFILKKKLKILSSNIFKHQNSTTLPSSPNLQTSPPPFFSSSLPPPPPPLLPKPPPPPPLLPHPPPPLLPPRHSPTAVCLSPFSLSLFCACRCVPPSRGVGRPFDRQRGGCECCRASEREGCLSRTEPSGGSYSGHRSSVGEGTRILQSVCTPTKLTDIQTTSSVADMKTDEIRLQTVYVCKNKQHLKLLVFSRVHHHHHCLRRFRWLIP
ncbi:uncharacterized protein LOC110924970 [Helianthus annuus]|uniref:uncharacterized protein LOC110924970 n=1 Tax=Helianthus annuus TaxID=4232 RepID=UPI000B8F53FC|nr:uncharacterized protein LOC110924970 [Helianthus annuus]